MTNKAAQSKQFTTTKSKHDNTQTAIKIILWRLVGIANHQNNHQKTQSNKQRAEEKGTRRTPCTRSRSFCFIYQNDKTKHERPRKTAPQGTKQGNARETPSQATNEPHGANNKPTRATKGETMTAEEWKTLKKAQAQAIRAGNLADINRINKALFEERERRQKAKERAREKERERLLSAKISTFCEKMLSAENGREL